jgi:hypothetical protein
MDKQKIIDTTIKLFNGKKFSIEGTFEDVGFDEYTIQIRDLHFMVTDMRVMDKYEGQSENDYPFVIDVVIDTTMGEWCFWGGDTFSPIRYGVFEHESDVTEIIHKWFGKKLSNYFSINPKLVATCVTCRNCSGLKENIKIELRKLL